MQIPKSAIERAIEGGWHSEYPDCQIITCSDWYITVGSNQLNCKGTASSSVALDKTFWLALGKNLGWDIIVPESSCVVCGEPMPKGEEMFKYHGYSQECTKPPLHSKHWADEAKRFYDLILQGKPTTGFWTDVLN